MQVIYALEAMPESITRSIFLAGPTPRDDDGNPWRREALRLLEASGYDGVVYVPEPRDGKWHRDYDAQLEWEDLCLNQADCIVFWVPRDLATMPAFTTNIEWGRWESSGKLVLGYPDDAAKMTYMQHYATKLKIPSFSTLDATLASAIKFIGPGVYRVGGERMVPLYIWRTKQFQSWLWGQFNVGNRLDDARVLFNFRPKNGSFVFLWTLHVNVFVASENRNKTNEFVLARTDISSVLMYQRDPHVLNTKIVLVREYRSPGNTFDGFVRELPGGSATEDDQANVVASHEVYEETGLQIDPIRLKIGGARQLAGTFSPHRSHLFSVELTEKEMEWLESQQGIMHGNIQDSEQTYIEVYQFRDILYKELTDWSTIGMITSVLLV